MEKSKRSWIKRWCDRGITPPPLPAITGPLLGLAYIIAMPLIGAFASLVLCGYRVSRITAALRR